MYRHAFVAETAITAIANELRRSRWVETGGALAGYVSVDNAMVITDASGPGPRAVKRPWSIIVDGAHTSRFCDQIYNESGGRLDYVGDWHVHLGASLAYSAGDLDAMRMIDASGVCKMPHPVSVIYSRGRDALAVYAFAEGKLTPIPTSIIRAVPEY